LGFDLVEQVRDGFVAHAAIEIREDVLAEREVLDVCPE
jgi:hypothetical protein